MSVTGTSQSQRRQRDRTRTGPHTGHTAFTGSVAREYFFGFRTVKGRSKHVQADGGRSCHQVDPGSTTRHPWRPHPVALGDLKATQDAPVNNAMNPSNQQKISHGEPSIMLPSGRDGVGGSGQRSSILGGRHRADGSHGCVLLRTVAAATTQRAPPASTLMAHGETAGADDRIGGSLGGLPCGQHPRQLDVR